MTTRPELRDLDEDARMEWFRARVRRWEARTLVVVVVVSLVLFAIVVFVVATKRELPPDAPVQYDGPFGPRNTGR